MSIALEFPDPLYNFTQLAAFNLIPNRFFTARLTRLVGGLTWRGGTVVTELASSHSVTRRLAPSAAALAAELSGFCPISWRVRL